MILKLENLRIDLAGQTIIEDFSLNLSAGQCVVLSGASGCGKTTILRAIAHLTEYQAGEIINHAQKSAYLFQEPRLLPWLTARENIVLIAPTASEEALQALFLELGLEIKDLDKYPHELSGGMSQRVALARGLIIEPDLILMDEPFSALDAVLREALQRKICRLIEGGTAVILVTHDLHEALLLGHQIYRLGGQPTHCQEMIDLSEPYDIRHRAWLDEALLKWF